MKKKYSVFPGLLIILITALPLAATAQTSDLTLEQRLQRVEGELAIRRVLVDYSATMDARDFAAYVALFARDGEWVNGDIVHKGREAIHQMLIDLYGPPPTDYVNNSSYHISSNAQIDIIDGDRATAHSRHLLVMRGPEGEPTPMLAGRYEDEFIREDGEWKILRRVDYPVMPTPEEWSRFLRARRAEQSE